MTRTQISIDDQPYPLEVLDTAGTLDLEHDLSLADWIRNSIGVVLVYDATSRKSYDRIRYLLRRVYEIKGTSDFLPIMVVGNKSDKETSRVVSPKEGAELAGELGCMFANASATNFEDVLDSFYRLVEVLVGLESPRGYAWTSLLGGGSDNGCCIIM
ncbi:hypothetical protein NPX13_g10620 [Xylaria arbuscula]|uniref:small monomeric GTPase n=1 Tax=Xylaria arbuscula TaxID=114810 RepID=A0A9W8N4P1_9PEZI|nr:hypothetical protein NPX13_g10620 [Xylaria arbuscula]